MESYNRLLIKGKRSFIICCQKEMNSLRKLFPLNRVKARFKFHISLLYLFFLEVHFDYSFKINDLWLSGYKPDYYPGGCRFDP